MLFGQSGRHTIMLFLVWLDPEKKTQSIFNFGCFAFTQQMNIFVTPTFGCFGPSSKQALTYPSHSFTVRRRGTTQKSPNHIYLWLVYLDQKNPPTCCFGCFPLPKKTHPTFTFLPRGFRCRGGAVLWHTCFPARRGETDTQIKNNILTVFPQLQKTAHLSSVFLANQNHTQKTHTHQACTFLSWLPVQRGGGTYTH